MRGGTSRWSRAREGLCYWRRRPDFAHKPSPTIQAQPGPNVGPFHWDSRRLRVPEVKRLFTFPDDFSLVGTRSSIQAQLGNAVPPLLARRVVDQVAAVTP